MNYADLLERAGRVEAALAMRQHAWVLAQRAAASARNTAAARSALFAQLRMAAQFAGGEQKARLWRALGESMRAPNDPQATAAMSAERRRQERDLVGAWLLSQGRFDAAQRWLWEQQAARQAVPAYQKMALAIESGDKDALADALELAAGKVSGEIDPRDRLTALRQLGRTAEAATEGSLQAMAAPEGVPEELDLLLRQDLLTQASRAQAVVTQRRTGALERRTWQAQGSLVLVPSTCLQIDALNSSNRTLNTTRLAAVPAHDRELAVSLGTVARWGEAQLGVFVREALATVVGARLRLTQRLSEKSSLQLELAHNERAEESTALALAGMRDRAAVRLNLRASERVDGELSLSAQRYRTQHGSRLGTGADASATVNWYLRRDDPDLRLQFQLRRNVTRADGTLDAASAALVPAFAAPDASFYLPAGGTAIAATLGWGLNRTDPLFYGHTMRPWAEVGLETRRGQGVTQTQPLLRAGIKGGVWGRDQLSLQFEVRPGRGIGGGAAAGSESTREIRAQYDLFFDR